MQTLVISNPLVFLRRCKPHPLARCRKREYEISMLVSSWVIWVKGDTRRLIRHTSRDSRGSPISMQTSAEENSFVSASMPGSMVR
ncbi:hypothetical protein D3C78_1796740 [compost metagenome]